MRVLSGILGVLVIIGGIYCLATPAATFFAVIWIIGFVMLFDGIANIITWAQNRKSMEGSGFFLASAIISVIFAIILLGNFFVQFVAGAIIVYMIAIWFLIIGIARIVGAFKLRKAQKELRERNVYAPVVMGLSWGWALTFGILSLLCGVVSVITPAYLAGFIGIVVGISVIVAGVNMIGFAIRAK